MSLTPTRGQSGATTPTTARPGTYTRRRPSEFLLPDGRRVLVALPEEAEALRQKHKHHHHHHHHPHHPHHASEHAHPARAEEQQQAEQVQQVEVVVHGSHEHTALLHESRRHHEARRDALRARHGDGALREWDAVRRGLDGVTAQLARLADHSAAGLLRENFSRFGYDARLRTYGDGGGGGGGRGEENKRQKSSASTSLVGEHGGPGQEEEEEEGQYSGGEGEEEAVDWDDRSGEGVRLFRVPVVKQYFHRGLLWRASGDSEVMPYELFFDLLFVGIVAVNGDHASEAPTGRELLRFAVTFCMGWKLWADVTQLVEWFETGDVLNQVGLLFLFACLLG